VHLRISSARSANTYAVVGWVFALLTAVLSTAQAQSMSCESIAREVVTIQGNPFPNARTPALTDAIAAALNEAITRQRGVYLSASASSFERFRWNLQGEVKFESSVQEQIQVRFAGFVVGFSIVEERDLGPGWVEVTLSVDVCLDDRIALGIEGDSSAAHAVRSTLVRDIRAAGWQILHGAPSPSASESDLLAFVFETGITYSAHVDLSNTVERSGDFVSSTVTLDATLVDLRTMQVAHAFSETETAVAGTEDAALQEAGERLGAELARAWNQVFLKPESRRRATFIFGNVNRPGTRFTLQDIVSQIETVLSVTSVEYVARNREVHMHVEAAGDPCGVASLVPTNRRVLTVLERCTGSSALFHVSGD
jgi:hypothetical protein